MEYVILLALVIIIALLVDWKREWTKQSDTTNYLLAEKTRKLEKGEKKTK